MPSRKPRIALTIDDNLNSVLQSISDLTGEPKTKIITQFLNDLLPVFEDIEKSLRHVKDAKEAIPQLARWTAFANQQVAIMNNQMADLYIKDNQE